MQRISAGTLRGRKLMPLPRGVSARPTASRVREAIFDRLQDAVVGRSVLDLFAGSGALAIEALSRGAACATLIDRDGRIVQHLHKQLSALGLQERVRVMQGDLPTILGRGPANCSDVAAYELVLLDPPYAEPELVESVLHALVRDRWLARDAVIVCERQRVRGKLPAIQWPEALVLQATRTYGQTVVDFLSHPSDAPTAR